VKIEKVTDLDDDNVLESLIGKTVLIQVINSDFGWTVYILKWIRDDRL
jgi:hypothetical protein